MAETYVDSYRELNYRHLVDTWGAPGSMHPALERYSADLQRWITRERSKDGSLWWVLSRDDVTFAMQYAGTVTAWPGADLDLPVDLAGHPVKVRWSAAVSAGGRFRYCSPAEFFTTHEWNYHQFPRGDWKRPAGWDPDPWIQKCEVCLAWHLMDRLDADLSWR